MTAYEQLIDEIQTLPASASASLRQRLLGPRPLPELLDLVPELPTVRHRIGPRPWYDYLEKSHPFSGQS